MNSSIIFQIRSLLQSAQSILIAFPKDADDDVVAAGLALYLTLQKMRKQASVVCPADIKVAQAHLFGINKISKQLAGGNTLVIALPYKEGTIEKVSYNIEGDKFNLVIEPRGERLSFNPNDVEYNFGKGDYDMVVVMGASDLSDLGDIYETHKNIFQKALVNIDNHQNNTRFGQINIVEDGPISQTMTTLFRTLRLPLDQDPASNLYTGIASKQGSLRLDTASPDMLEALAYLMRSKAELLLKSGKTLEQPSQKPLSSNSQKAINQEDQNTIEETPEDWLKPKIFHTNNNN